MPAPAAAGGRSIGAAFDPRRNARDPLRLVLALLVVVSHALVLGRHRSEVLLGYGTLSGIAVDVFFAISGYLIAASAAHDHVGRYLWQRFLRIFPGFWACPAVTAVVAGPVAWIASGRPFGACGAPSGPPHDRAANAGLCMTAWDIAGTSAHVPHPAVWDGSLWTLELEDACYLLVAALAVACLLRRRRVVLGLWAGSWATPGLAAAAVPTWTDTNLHDPLRFVPIFFAGVVLGAVPGPGPRPPVAGGGRHRRVRGRDVAPQPRRARRPAARLPVRLAGDPPAGRADRLAVRPLLPGVHLRLRRRPAPQPWRGHPVGPRAVHRPDRRRHRRRGVGVVRARGAPGAAGRAGWRALPVCV